MGLQGAPPPLRPLEGERATKWRGGVGGKESKRYSKQSRPPRQPKPIAPRATSPPSEPSEPPHRLVFIDQCLTIAMYRDSSPTAQNDTFGGRVSIEQTSPSGVHSEHIL